MAKKIPYAMALALVESGDMKENALEKGIEKGLIAGKRELGASRTVKSFVSDEQKEFYGDKQNLLKVINETVSNIPEVNAFFQNWGEDWEIDGKKHKLEVSVYVKGFTPCLNSFEAE